MTTRPILITGGSGFIGRHLTKRLLERGDRLLLLSRPNSVLPSMNCELVQRIDCFTWTSSNIKRVLEPYDFKYVFHLASYGVNPNDRDDHMAYRLNTLIPQCLVSLAAERNSGMLMTGSCSEYAIPHNDNLLTETHPLTKGRSVYGFTKAEGGARALTKAQLSKVSFTLLRLFNVYGAGEASHRLLPHLHHRLTQGKPALLSPGLQVRDFVYINDVIDALIATYERTLSPSCLHTPTSLNICSGIGSTVREFAETVADVLKADRSLLHFNSVPVRDGESHRLVGCPNKARSELNWSTKYALRQGVSDAISNMILLGSEAR